MSAEFKMTPETMMALKEMLIQHVPHMRALGVEIIDAAPAQAWLRVPYDERFIGNVETGVIHGGVITTVLDNTCGMAVQLAMDEPQAIATLDLRIDYMKPATPGLALTTHAHCYKTTRNIAFVRGTAYHTDIDDPIASCVGTFMIGANRTVPTSVAAAKAFMAKQKKEG
ncbi:PaaI family thioesterase [Parvibaculum sp.]|uniref:PaaI family thioesterase n=1 Tax=Parvibaculum sp. TaxID=2024848 RepID=UPI00320F5388